MKTRIARVLAALVVGLAFIAGPAAAADKKPNILVIWGDDIGMWNVGAYSHGMMGKTPSIDRIGKEGMLFTDHYGQPSCTAGPRRVHHGAAAHPHRHDDHRHPRLDARDSEIRSHARRGAQDAGLRDRAVRQEPPGRPQRVPADRAWL